MGCARPLAAAIEHCSLVSPWRGEKERERKRDRERGGETSLSRGLPAAAESQLHIETGTFRV